MKATVAAAFALTALFCIASGKQNFPFQRHPLLQRANLRLAGGTEAQPHEAPYMAYIKFSVKPDGNKQRICSGTLISKNYVLTAMECTTNAKDAEIVLGLHNVTEIGTKQAVQQIKNVMESTTVHENADLALIKLNQPVNEVKGVISYAKLPRKNGASNRYKYKFMMAKIYGWGAESSKGEPSQVLRVSEAKVMDTGDVCSGMPKLIYGDSRLHKRGLCEGDGGAPFIVDYEGELLQIGVANWRDKNCEAGYGFVFTEVPQYLDWIGKNSDAVIRD